MQRRVFPLLCGILASGAAAQGPPPGGPDAPGSVGSVGSVASGRLPGAQAVADLPPAAVRLNPTRGEIVIELPPADVGSAKGEHAGMLRLPLYRVDLPASGSIHAFRILIQAGSGEPLPADRLHHVILFDPEHRELFTPVVHRALAAGKETGAVSVPWLLFGMPITRGQRLIAAAMITNPDTAVLRHAKVQIVMSYTPLRRPWPVWRVYPWFIDVTFPLGGAGGSKAFDLPPGRSEHSWSGSPAIAGTVIALGGHLHDHAVGLEFRDETSGQLIWRARPVTDGLGRVVALPRRDLYRWYRLGVRISPRHRYRLTVVYYNPGKTTLPAAGMGEVAGLFVPDGRQPMAMADPTGPLYRLDLYNILKNLSDQKAGHTHARP